MFAALSVDYQVRKNMNMEVSKELIESMKRLGWEKGEEWSDQEASEAASRLVEVFVILMETDRRLHPGNYRKPQPES